MGPWLHGEGFDDRVSGRVVPVGNGATWRPGDTAGPGDGDRPRRGACRLARAAADRREVGMEAALRAH